MARGRIISPDFWTDGNMIGLSPFARLFYIGLWNFTNCDKGHLHDDPMALKLKILPVDQIDPDALLNELIARDRVRRLVSPDGASYLFIPTMAKHQKTDVRWKTRCPACAQEDSLILSETQESLVEHAVTLPNSELRQDKTRQSKPLSTSGERASAYSEAFLSWWAVYPRKESKGAAYKAWESLRKKGLLPAPEVLLPATEKYRGKGLEPQFMKLPAGWLNDGKWDDEATTTQVIDGWAGMRRFGDE